MTEPATSKTGKTEPGEVVQRLVDAINLADDRALTELLHEDFVDHTPNPLQGNGREAFVAKIGQLRAAFSNLRLRVEQVVAEGDRVTFLWTLTGTNDGPFADQDPTGINVEFAGMNLERMSAGTIVEHWSIHDALSLFHQLGRLG
jgi:predicted ester cyclase